MTSLLTLIIASLISLGQVGEPARANAGGAALTTDGASPTASVGGVVLDREIVAPRRSGGATGPAGKGAEALVEGLWPLGVVLGLILGGAVLLRRIFPKRGGADGGELIRVISRQYLSPKQSICLVRIGTRVMALGVTAERISMLSQIEDGAAASRIVGAAESGRANSMNGRFQSFLTGASSAFGDAVERETSGTTRGKPRDALTAVRRLRESVRGAGQPIARG